MFDLFKFELKLQLSNKLLWIISVIIIVDVFFTQLGYNFFPEFIKGFSAAKRDFNSIEEYKGFVRLFYDYVGYDIYTFFVFISAFSFYKEYKYKIEDIIYTKKISTVKYVLSKYFALCTIIFLIILLMSLLGFATFRNAYLSGTIEGMLIFLSYGVYFIFPSILFMVAVCFLICVRFKSYKEVLLCYFITYVPVVWQMNIKNYYFKIIIRMNGEYATSEIYNELKNSIYINRIFITTLSFVFLALVCSCYEKNRCSKKHLSGFGIM